MVQSVVQPLQRASEREICGWIDIWLIDRREENGESYPRIHTPESFTNVKGLRRLSGLALRRFFGPRARLAWLTPLLPLRRSCLSLPHRSFVRSTNTVAALFQYVSLAAGSRSPPPVVVVALARARSCVRVVASLPLLLASFRVASLLFTPCFWPNRLRPSLLATSPPLSPSLPLSLVDMSSAKCAICNKTAYPLESLKAIEKTYHKICFKCT